MAKKNSIWKKAGIAALILIVILTIAKSAGWLGNSDAVKVSTEKVSLKTITETVSANGKVQPEVEVKISADVSGEVVEMFVKEGDLVQAGTLLCRIKPDIYASNLERTAASVNAAKANLQSSRSRQLQAESQFKIAELSYNRNKKLFEDKVISAAEFESIRSSWEVASAEVQAAHQGVAAAEFNVNSAEASLKEARENLNKTAIYSPVNGTVSKLNVEQGERVVGTLQMAGTEIMRIANLNEMEVNVDVGETDIVRVNLNDTADIEIDAYTGRKFTGIVTEVANSANVSGVGVTDQVTNFSVKIRIIRNSYTDLLKDKPENFSPFRPGMSATVDIRTKQVSNVAAIPIQAVTTRDTSVKDDVASKMNNTSGANSTEVSSNENRQECVFVINDDKAVLRNVKTGIQDNQFIQIVEGLKEGDEVITAPYNAISKTLKDGSDVKVVPRSELFDRKDSKS